MFRRKIVLLGLLVVMIATLVPAAAKADTKINVNISVQLSPAFVGLPMPASYGALPRAKKHWDHSWTEYRVYYPVPVMLGFYRLNMPRHGWTAVFIGPGRMVWVQGRRQMETCFWAAPGGYTVIAVRETNRIPPGQLKKGWSGKGKRW